MSVQTAVTAPPIGASRSLDWYMNEDGTGLQQALIRGRLLGSLDPSRTSSNADNTGTGMVLTNAYQFGPVQVGGKWTRMCKVQGDICFNIIPLITSQPSLRDLGWPIGRYVWEGLFSWPEGNPGALVDSCLMLGLGDHARMLNLNAQGIALGNVGGVLRFYTRGLGGAESVDVSAAAGPLALQNKLTLIVQQAGLNRPASVTALVNDRVVAARSWIGAHKLPLPAAGVGSLAPQLTHGANAFNLWVSQVRFSSGPDVADL